MEKILLVGLGNPGDTYVRTRHNLGIRMLRDWFEVHKAFSVKEWREDRSAFAEVAQLNIKDKRVDCLFPLTYMNDSGKAVAHYAQKEGIAVEDMLVLHDDLESPFGEIKFKAEGGAGGHKGVRSIHQHLGTRQIARLRLGIGRPPEGKEVDKFVLQKFTSEEEVAMEALSRKTTDFLTEYLEI